MYTYACGFNISLGTLAWLYTAEILPAKGVSVAVFLNWSTSMLTTFFFPLI